MPRSPLHDEHVRLGARIVPFGGWDMPLEYGGTIAEHRTCRTGSAMFDVSHLGTVRLDDPAAFDRLQRTLTNDLGKIGPGRAQYTHLLDDEGSVVDDIIVWWYRSADDRADVFDVMPNASNTEGVRAAIGGTDVTEQRAVIAVQGPDARERVRAVFPAAAEVGRFRVARCTLGDVECVVAGTGYTGEDGIEIAVPAPAAAALWRALEEAGVVPAGLGARDTLRLEAGLPLHGHELGPGITPLQAGLSRVVAFGKGEFRGRDALERERIAGPARRLVGIATEGRRPPRSGCPIVVDGVSVGTTTSGNFSPVLGHGIALGFVPADVADGATVDVDVRGTMLAGTVVPTPFVRR